MMFRPPTSCITSPEWYARHSPAMQWILGQTTRSRHAGPSRAGTVPDQPYPAERGGGAAHRRDLVAGTVRQRPRPWSSGLQGTLLCRFRQPVAACHAHEGTDGRGRHCRRSTWGFGPRQLDGMGRFSAPDSFSPGCVSQSHPDQAILTPTASCQPYAGHVPRRLSLEILGR